METTANPDEPMVDNTATIVPMTFAADAFDDDFAELSFAQRQQWADEAFAVVDSLEVSGLQTPIQGGSATYDGLLRLDYSGYVSELSNETYLVASSLGKMTLSVDFVQFDGDTSIELTGSADSFVLDDGTPLEGEYELFHPGQRLNTDGSPADENRFVVYMDGSLGAGTTRYSGDANMYLDVSGENADYVTGTVSGELQIWNTDTPLVGTIYGTTSGSVVANLN